MSTEELHASLGAKLERLSALRESAANGSPVTTPTALAEAQAVQAEIEQETSAEMARFAAKRDAAIAAHQKLAERAATVSEQAAARSAATNEKGRLLAARGREAMARIDAAKIAEQKRAARQAREEAARQAAENYVAEMRNWSAVLDDSEQILINPPKLFPTGSAESIAQTNPSDESRSSGEGSAEKRDEGKPGSWSVFLNE